MPLPQMRPLSDRRPPRGRRRPKDEGIRPFCFMDPLPLFGGCQICSADDDDIHASRIDRLYSTWETQGFCASKAGADEVIEMEEETSLGVEESSLGDESSTEADYPAAKAVSSVPGQRDSSVWRTGGGDEDPLQEQVEVVMRATTGVFAERGWTLAYVSRGRYMLNGRSIKLSLLPQGAPLPYFTHHSTVLGFDAAESGSRITVCDGPLRQPLFDYLMQTGQNETYDQRGTENPAGVTGAAKYLDFNVAPTGDRMIAMKHATIQAEMRRRADGTEEATRTSALQNDGGRLLGGRPVSGGSVILARAASAQDEAGRCVAGAPAAVAAAPPPPAA